MKTQCCVYEIDDTRPVVMWNPFNKVVQCHNCGQVYEPGHSKQIQLDAWRQGMTDALTLVREHYCPPGSTIEQKITAARDGRKDL